MTMMWSNDGKIISVVQIDQRDPDYLEIAGDDNDNVMLIGRGRQSPRLMMIMMMLMIMMMIIYIL